MTAATSPADTVERLVPGACVLGVTSTGSVTVLAVERHGSHAVTVTFRDAAGKLDDATLLAAQLARLRIVDGATGWRFTADGAEFRLAAEALRIRMAGLFDPMLAVATSDLEPLPHQIRAVYWDLLPRMPLRFLLADDPGAGKTIMAGLYAKELALRGDLARCLIVVPGGLVEQWQEELATKFGLNFAVLTGNPGAGTVPGQNVFDAQPLLIARMDQLARSEDLLAALDASQWDLVVVDEAHRMAARYDGADLKKTARYQLGERLGAITRHLLLMTATPHAGKDEDFELFLALLDPDRFAGRYRKGVHASITDDLMRRTVKEDLLTFEGKRLFPQRIAETLPYTLSDDELQLYEEVTRYVREEMNRAEKLAASGDGRKRNTVGFALTVLQRRLASSPEAIYKSLQRRRKRLEHRRDTLIADPTAEDTAEDTDDAIDVTDLDEEFATADTEILEDRVSDGATAARTVAELDVEITVLAGLERLAARVRASGEDRKWAELRSLMQDTTLMRDADGRPRKLIVFTEHKDTLTYLAGRLGDLIGREDAVVAIHGTVRRKDRRRVREQFTHDPRCQVLLATDAAGEGLNLQCAHLMINYDLPWNPNRIEQRFGRIHRIGQTEVCRLWNLVAEQTREGQVFACLLNKIEVQRQRYGGKVFDVLGNCFTDKSLREVLIEAIRYGDEPARKAELDAIIDAEISVGLPELLDEHALHSIRIVEADVELLRQRMDQARARRLQPHYIELFFTAAFTGLGGRISKREQGRWEITHVPAALRDRRLTGTLGAPVVSRYARITFTAKRITADGAPRAELLAPGHPLLDAVVDATIEAHHHALTDGAVLVDPADHGTQPRLLLAVTEEITDGTGRVVAKRFDFVTLTADGAPTVGGSAPYLDTESLAVHVSPERHVEVIEGLVAAPWLSAGVDKLVTSWAITHGLPQFLQQTSDRLLPAIEKTRGQATARLTQQINHWYSQSVKLREEQAAGRKPKRSPDWALATARDLETRLAARTARLDAEAHLLPKPPTLAGAALVVPIGYLAARGLLTDLDDAPPPEHAKDTAEVDRRAIAATLAAEHSLGRTPTEMPHNNPGYDIEAVTPDGRTIFIEVKGRLLGAQDFSITYNEVLLAKNTAPHHRLALVAVHPDGAQHDEIRYVEGSFTDFEIGSFAATAVRGDWKATWDNGAPPH